MLFDKLSRKFRGSRSILRTVPLLVILILGLSSTLAVAQTDVTPPELTALAFNPISIDTTSASATVTVSFTVTDDISGAQYAWASFRSPGGAVYRSNGIYFTPSASYSGNFDVEFPQFDRAGTWTLDSVTVGDDAGNYRYLYTADLVAAGFPTDLTVISLEDATAPDLDAFDFSPKAIDTSSDSATVTVSFALSDDLSGAVQFSVEFRSPGGASYRSGYASFDPQTSLSDSVDVVFPQFGRAGTWTVNQVNLYDNVGNRQTLNISDLAAAGFPTDLDVTSIEDVAAPEVTEFNFSPKSIQTFFGPAETTVSFRVTDDAAGVNYISVRFVDPLGQTYVYASRGYYQPPNLDISDEIVANFPESSPPGMWTVEQIYVTDNIGNSSTLYTNDIAALGWPTQLLLAGPIDCTLEIDVSFPGDVLTLDFLLGTGQAARWDLWLFSKLGIQSLLATPVPAIDPPASFPIPLTSFPDLGYVGFASTLTTGDAGVVCVDFQIVDSGGAGLSAAEVSKMIERAQQQGFRASSLVDTP